MKVFTLSFGSDSNEKMFARLITTQEPLQIDFWMDNPKAKKTTNILDAVRFNLFLDYKPELFLYLYGFYSERSFHILKEFMNIEKCDIHKFFYEQMLFYCVVPPSITPDSFFEEGHLTHEAISMYWKPDMHYFRIHKQSHIYVSERFCEVIQKHQLKGFNYTLAWEGEPSR